MKTLLVLAALVLSANAIAADPKPPILCLDEVCAAPEPEPSGKGIKWHPGHYMLVHRGDSHERIMTVYIPELCREGSVRGLQVRLDWYTLESSKGAYTFGQVDDMYNALAACGKRLVVQVRAAGFNTTSTSNIVPDYLLRDPIYNGGLAPTRSGFIAKVWEAPVMDRLIALYQALGARYDSKPYFEAIVYTETATSGVESGYTADQFVTQLKRAVKGMATAWPTTNVVMFNNFIQGSTQAQRIELFDTLHQNRAGTGGPDVLPPPHEPNGEMIYRGLVDGNDRRGKIPALFAVQTPELGGKDGDFLPKQLYDHCVGTNRCSHMFWIRNMDYGSPSQQWPTGILPFLRTNPPTHQTCPASYSACIRTPAS